jgi:hypothetical protein
VNLSEHGKLPSFDPGASRRDARKLDRSDPVLKNGISEGAQERAVEAGRGMKKLKARLLQFHRIDPVAIMDYVSIFVISGESSRNGDNAHSAVG